MALTKSDIENIGFEHSLRGYDVHQVDDFLEIVAEGVEALNNEIASLKEQLAIEKPLVEEAKEENEQVDEVDLTEVSIEELLKEEPATESLGDKEAQAELDVAKERAEAEARRAEEAEAKIAKLQEQLEEKAKLDNTISEAFIAAQRSAEQIKEDARAEADRIYQESQTKARDFLRDSLANKAAIDSEATALQKSAEKFRTDYLEMLDRFMEQAKKEFGDLSELTISDEEVDQKLPDLDSIPEVTFTSKVEEKVVEASDDEAPRLTTDQIPHIELPDVVDIQE